ncbi:MAG TPA: amidohydrolase family protein [Opitutaceae bacterium]
MPEIRECVVLHGPDLEPRRCQRFAWVGDTITAIELGEACSQLEAGALVVMPGLINGHTHVADSALPDGATGLTLEEAFFRPAGYKYRELAKLSEADHLPHIEAHLRYMARTGTVCHVDFREQGAYGAELLRKASTATGVRSVILSQFNTPPFAPAELAANVAALPASARDELAAILGVADGFSESTMNDLTDSAWQEIRTTTTAARRLRAIHCLENAGYRELSLARTGRGDLIRALELYAPHLVVHMTAANADEIALLAQHGTTAVVNPRANAVLGLSLPPVSALLRAGANLLLGTDNGMLNSPNLLAELDFTWKLARSQAADATSPAPAAILRMTTRNAHAVLGDEFPGSLESGLPATFAVLDFTASHLRSTRHVLASIVSRVTPADVLATYRHGESLWSAPGFAV